MKSTKTIISLIAVFAIALGTFTACGKKTAETVEGEITTGSQTSISEESKTEELSETSETTKATETKKTEQIAKTESVKFCDPEKNGKRIFNEFMAYVINCANGYTAQEPPCDDNGYSEKEYFDYNYKNYDSTSKNATKAAYEMMLGLPYYSIFDELNDCCEYDTKSFYKIYNPWDESAAFVRDPLKKFDEENKYMKADGAKFDMLLQTIFNVKPDHSFTLSSNAFSDDKEPVFYYYDGNYYILKGDGGDGIGPRVVTNEYTKLSDGRYKVNITFQFGNDIEGFKDIATLNVIAGLKEVGDNTLWSIYSYEKV